MPGRHLGLLVGLYCLGGSVAWADRSIFLNGVRIDGVTNQTFRGCDVTIDSQGNVLITARGYAVERKEVKEVGGAGPPVQVITQTGPAASAPAPASDTMSVRLGKRYFLVSMQNRTGATQYDIDVFINQKFVKTVRSRDAQQTIVEVTPYMFAGQNHIVMSARKNYGGGGRTSSSPADFFKIIIGEGSESAGKVVLENPLVDYKRTADETQNVNGDYQVKAR